MGKSENDGMQDGDPGGDSFNLQESPDLQHDLPSFRVVHVCVIAHADER